MKYWLFYDRGHDPTAHHGPVAQERRILAVGSRLLLGRRICAIERAIASVVSKTNLHGERTGAYRCTEDARPSYYAGTA